VLRATPNQDLVKLAGSLAHELANIFTAAAGNLSLLDDYPAENEAYRQIFIDIRRAYTRGFDVIDRLKAISGRQALHVERTDLNPLIEAALEDLRPALVPRIAIELRLSEEPCIADIDRDCFRGALTELVANAREAMPKGGKLRVESQIVAGDGKASFVRVSVGDTGIGMKPDIAAHAFEPLVTTKSKDFRNGWGLTICEGFTRQCGGFAELESESGRGTRVSLTLPQACSREDAVRDPAQTSIVTLATNI
jgi:signal transduction histidine kinase